MSERDKKIPILMFHEIYRPEERDRLRGVTNPVYNTEVNVFRNQMSWLRSNNIKTLTIDELILQKSQPKLPFVCLTFDDGWLGNYLHAYPILKEYGFKATFFVATELLGKPFHMTWNQLKEIQASNMSIQSHTVTHRPLGGMEGKKILFELTESKKIIESKLSTEVRHLSLPHGHKGDRIWPLAKEIGYQRICTSDIGFYILGSSGPWLKRISVGNGVSEKQFRLIIQGEDKAIRGIIIVKDFKNAIRRTIGVDNYRKLYQWVYKIGS